MKRFILGGIGGLLLGLTVACGAVAYADGQNKYTLVQETPMTWYGPVACVIVLDSTGEPRGISCVK